MPKIYGEGRPAGQERRVINFDNMTEEDKAEWALWIEALAAPIPPDNDENK
jgi:hypothetical protein